MLTKVSVYVKICLRWSSGIRMHVFAYVHGCHSVLAYNILVTPHMSNAGKKNILKELTFFRNKNTSSPLVLYLGHLETCFYIVLRTLHEKNPLESQVVELF